jgi:hypothetical protein
MREEEGRRYSTENSNSRTYESLYAFSQPYYQTEDAWAYMFVHTEGFSLYGQGAR